MFNKKDEGMVDLEYMIPKEFKEETHVVEESEPVRGSTYTSCHACSRTSHDAVLVPVVHQGENKWMCPRCLKRTIDSDAEPSYYSSTPAHEETPSYSDTPETNSYSSEPSTPDYTGSSPMSMFD